MKQIRAGIHWKLQIVLTKCDLLERADIARRITVIRNELTDALPGFSNMLPIMTVSGLERKGIIELQKELASLVPQDAARLSSPVSAPAAIDGSTEGRNPPANRSPVRSTSSQSNSLPSRNHHHGDKIDKLSDSARAPRRLDNDRDSNQKDAKPRSKGDSHGSARKNSWGRGGPTNKAKPRVKPYEKSAFYSDVLGAKPDAPAGPKKTNSPGGNEATKDPNAATTDRKYFKRA